MTPTKASPESREGVDHDGPCGDPGQLFSYIPKYVLRWLDRFYGSHERLEILLISASEMRD
jgi:hypothetical protein